jgi:ABC-2 type transport system permease protein
MMREAIITEVLKARRSRLPWLSVAAFGVATAVGALFMFILADPDRARSLGLLGAKAQLSGATADWPGYLSFLAQTTAVGGIGVFGVIVIWTFGREFSDHTAKDLLALPTPRTTIVVAKFAVTGVWCLLLALQTYVLGLAAGAALQLPGWDGATALRGLARLLTVAIMTWLLVSVLALAASAWQGYLAAVGLMFLIVFLAQIVATLGYGHIFPWSVPGVLSGLSGGDRPAVGVLGYALVAIVGAAGTVATVLWWRNADQNR